MKEAETKNPRPNNALKNVTIENTRIEQDIEIMVLHDA